ncbi:unnamed protein product [Pedinophyceae sp. YPF-701]|nr:unnamed protein product [Pedinophyceae sp. YPF-701]
MDSSAHESDYVRTASRVRAGAAMAGLYGSNGDAAPSDAPSSPSSPQPSSGSAALPVSRSPAQPPSPASSLPFRANSRHGRGTSGNAPEIQPVRPAASTREFAFEPQALGVVTALSDLVAGAAKADGALQASTKQMADRCVDAIFSTADLPTHERLRSFLGVLHGALAPMVPTPSPAAPVAIQPPPADNPFGSPVPSLSPNGHKPTWSNPFDDPPEGRPVPDASRAMAAAPSPDVRSPGADSAGAAAAQLRGSADTPASPVGPAALPRTQSRGQRGGHQRGMPSDAPSDAVSSYEGTFVEHHDISYQLDLGLGATPDDSGLLEADDEVHGAAQHADSSVALRMSQGGETRGRVSGGLLDMQRVDERFEEIDLSGNG